MSAKTDLRAVREQLGAMLPESTLDELRRNNHDLIAALDDLKGQKEQLLLLNAELAETNRGTPLNSITGLTRLLTEPEAGLGPEQVYQVGLIKSAPGTLLTLVNDLLDVAKAESGQGRPVDVVVSADGAPATVLTDELALTAILRNLLSNAIKYTDQGEVRLTMRAYGTKVEIRVADTGTGIPANQLERVFEEFYQLPGISRGGTGLGLPYARQLAGLLGGELTLASEAESEAAR